MNGPQLDLKATLSSYRAAIELQLRELVEPRDGCPIPLQNAMSYSLLSGGKRLRPILVLLACEACGGDIAAAMPAACAIEMVHTYSLVHDDLPAMDDDDYRRGKPSNHKVFGEGDAILAGDALLTLAFECIADGIQPARAAVDCIRELAVAAGACGMVGGQVDDLEAERRGSNDSGKSLLTDGSAEWNLDRLESIHRRKTGCLIAAALSMGAIVANAPAELRFALAEYGIRVGIAFQIADDLLDIAGDPTRMGKNVRKDSRHGKLTFPSLIGAEASRDRAARLVNESIESIRPLQERGQVLTALARFIIERDH